MKCIARVKEWVKKKTCWKRGEEDFWEKEKIERWDIRPLAICPGISDFKNSFALNYLREPFLNIKTLQDCKTNSRDFRKSQVLRERILRSIVLDHIKAGHKTTLWAIIFAVFVLKGENWKKWKFQTWRWRSVFSKTDVGRSYGWR